MRLVPLATELLKQAVRRADEGLESTGEDKTNMLPCLGYAAAARLSDKCDDGRRTKAPETFTLDVRSSHSPGPLPKGVGEVPLAGRRAAPTSDHAGTRDLVESVVEMADIAEQKTAGVNWGGT